MSPAFSIYSRKIVFLGIEAPHSEENIVSHAFHFDYLLVVYSYVSSILNGLRVFMSLVICVTRFPPSVMSQPGNKVTIQKNAHGFLIKYSSCRPSIFNRFKVITAFLSTLNSRIANLAVSGRVIPEITSPSDSLTQLCMGFALKINGYLLLLKNYLMLLIRLENWQLGARIGIFLNLRPLNMIWFKWDPKRRDASFDVLSMKIGEPFGSDAVLGNKLEKTETTLSCIFTHSLSGPHQATYY